MLTKNIATLDKHSIKSKLISLIGYSVQLNTLNANYTSFNCSFMSALLNLTYELSEPADRLLMLKAILDKLFHEFDIFKTETSKFTTEQQQQQQSAATVRTKIFNVRRQITAVILTICKTYSKSLTPILNDIYTQIGAILNQTQAETATQMERSILIQAIICCSNESQSFELQFTLVQKFLNPMIEFFEVNKANLANVDAFITLLSLDDPNNETSGLTNRKNLFFYINCLFGILNTITFLPNPTNESDSCQRLFISLFSPLLDLFRCFNQLHSSAKVNPAILAMTESIKSVVINSSAGGSQKKHAQNDLATEQQADKVLMFICHMYDTLNQLIGLYLSKFKSELLLMELNDYGQEFIYKVGRKLKS